MTNRTTTLKRRQRATTSTVATTHSNNNNSPNNKITKQRKTSNKRASDQLVDKGSTAFDNEEYEEAVRYFEEARNLYEDPLTTFALSSAYEACQQYEKSIHCLHPLTTNGNKYYKARANCDIGHLLISQQKYSDAIPYLDVAIQLFSDRMKTSHKKAERAEARDYLIFSYKKKSHACAEIKRTKEELDCNQKLVELVPDSSEVWYNLSAAQLALHLFDEALYSCTKTLELDPHCPLTNDLYRSINQSIAERAIEMQNATAVSKPAEISHERNIENKNEEEVVVEEVTMDDEPIGGPDPIPSLVAADPYLHFQAPPLPQTKITLTTETATISDANNSSILNTSMILDSVPSPLRMDDTDETKELRSWNEEEVASFIRGIHNDENFQHYAANFYRERINGVALAILKERHMLEYLGVNILGHRLMIIDAIKNQIHLDNSICNDSTVSNNNDNNSSNIMMSPSTTIDQHPLPPIVRSNVKYMQS